MPSSSLYCILLVWLGKKLLSGVVHKTRKMRKMLKYQRCSSLLVPPLRQVFLWGDGGSIRRLHCTHSVPLQDNIATPSLPVGNKATPLCPVGDNTVPPVPVDDSATPPSSLPENLSGEASSDCVPASGCIATIEAAHGNQDGSTTLDASSSKLNWQAISSGQPSSTDQQEATPTTQEATPTTLRSALKKVTFSAPEVVGHHQLEECSGDAAGDVTGRRDRKLKRRHRHHVGDRRKAREEEEGSKVKRRRTREESGAGIERNNTGIGR